MIVPPVLLNGINDRSYETISSGHKSTSHLFDEQIAKMNRCNPTCTLQMTSARGYSLDYLLSEQEAVTVGLGHDLLRVVAMVPAHKKSAA